MTIEPFDLAAFVRTEGSCCDSDNWYHLYDDTLAYLRRDEEIDDELAQTLLDKLLNCQDFSALVVAKMQQWRAYDMEHARHILPLLNLAVDDNQPITDCLAGYVRPGPFSGNVLASRLATRLALRRQGLNGSMPYGPPLSLVRAYRARFPKFFPDQNALADALYVNFGINVKLYGEPFGPLVPSITPNAPE